MEKDDDDVDAPPEDTAYCMQYMYHEKKQKVITPAQQTSTSDGWMEQKVYNNIIGVQHSPLVAAALDTDYTQGTCIDYIQQWVPEKRQLTFFKHCLMDLVWHASLDNFSPLYCKSVNKS